MAGGSGSKVDNLETQALPEEPIYLEPEYDNEQIPPSQPADTPMLMLASPQKDDDDNDACEPLQLDPPTTKPDPSKVGACKVLISLYTPSIFGWICWVG